MSCIALGKLNSHEFRPNFVMNYIQRSIEAKQLGFVM